jgi:hypothetical protein
VQVHSNDTIVILRLASFYALRVKLIASDSAVLVCPDFIKRNDARHMAVKHIFRQSLPHIDDLV